jgi:hypothetical protein
VCIRTTSIWHVDPSGTVSEAEYPRQDMSLIFCA